MFGSRSERFLDVSPRPLRPRRRGLRRACWRHLRPAPSTHERRGFLPVWRLWLCWPSCGCDLFTPALSLTLHVEFLPRPAQVSSCSSSSSSVVLLFDVLELPS
ncbi:unnamed protein product [Prorocentrum cordatum]|uniref:Uncharacterized protein n=1 Tax=Prorocentrum cordatum TaxID=2364126 RepID=A0ABN9XZW9_9DINO|nr:unnamed protein product [Polarella glacialis]